MLPLPFLSTNQQHFMYFRTTRLSKRPLTNAHRNILDGKLLLKYLGLNFTERLELAKRIGTTSTQVLYHNRNHRLGGQVKEPTVRNYK